MADTDLFPTWEDLKAKGLLAITDNGGKTSDRYSAVFLDGDVLGFSGNPTHPLGFSQWSSEVTTSDVVEWLDNGETLITDPPEWMQRHLLSRINEAYRDGIERSLNDDALDRKIRKTGSEAIDQIREAIIDECFTMAPLEYAAPRVGA